MFRKNTVLGTVGIFLTAILLVSRIAFPQNGAKVKVVASLPDYASIAKEIGGDYVVVDHIVAGNQNPHFVPPKPSYALKLKDADVFISTGLDLEMWVPTLIDKSRNPKIFEGAVGYVATSPGVKLLEVPTTNPDRSAGDIHIYGNPHIQTSPVNLRRISENILIGLQKVDPKHATYYEQRQKTYVARIDSAMFGPKLVHLLGGETLARLVEAGTLIDFLQNKEYGGEKLIHKLGGWLKAAMPFRGKRVIAYHKSWAYFCRDFGLEVVDHIEPKPGIPPSARHVKEVIDKIKSQQIKVMIVANYFEKKTPRKIEARTGIKAVFLPLSVGGVPEVKNTFDLFDYWIKQINRAFEEKP